MKPTFFDICEAIRATQDNNTLDKKDPYSRLLISLVEQNTSGDIVDTETLEEDINYAIGQFSKAFKAIKPFNCKEEPTGPRSGKLLSELKKIRRAIEAQTIVYYGNDPKEYNNEIEQDIIDLENHPFHLYQ